MARIEGTIARMDRSIAHQLDVIEGPAHYDMDAALERLRILRSSQEGYLAYRDWLLNYWELA